jgi:hypothetical protein
MFKFNNFPECGQWFLLLCDPWASATRPSLLHPGRITLQSLQEVRELRHRLLKVHDTWNSAFTATTFYTNRKLQF